MTAGGVLSGTGRVSAGDLGLHVRREVDHQPCRDEVLVADRTPASARALSRLPHASAINLDPEVTRYLDRPIDPAAIAAFYVPVQDHWSEHGFGFWALEAREPELAGQSSDSSASPTRHS